MKKLVTVALLVLSAMMLTSCNFASHGVGKVTSLSLLDAAQAELEKNGSGEIVRMEKDQLSDYQAALEEDGVEFRGTVTGVLTVSYNQDQEQGMLHTEMIGFDDAEDAETVAQYFEKKYAAEIAEGKARVTRNGWVLTVTYASFVLD